MSGLFMPYPQQLALCPAHSRCYAGISRMNEWRDEEMDDWGKLRDSVYSI